MRKKLTPLFETIPFENPVISEVEVGGQKFMRVHGVFGRADERNANNRIYPAKLIERETKSLAERSGKDTVFMQADHPADGVSRIADTAAILRSVTFDPVTKEQIGEADILKTRKGTDLAEIIRAGGKIGVSARGFGTTSEGEHAGQRGLVVNEDYKLVTFDFVVGQSTRGAVVTNFAEQAEELAGLTEEETDMDLKTLDLDALKAARPDIITAIEQAAAKAAKLEAEKSVADQVKEQTAAIEEKLRKELKLEKKKDDEDDDVEEMTKAAAKYGYRIEATCANDNERYGGGPGRKGKGKEDGRGSSATSQEDVDGPAEQEVLDWAKKHNLKLEKVDKTAAGAADPEVAKKFEQLNAQLKDAKLVMEQTTQRAQKLEEQLRDNDLKAYIFEKVAPETKFKNALTERLLKAGLKTKEEVDAKIPVEKADIQRLLTEASGKGETAKDEPIGANDEKKYKTADGKMTLTEAEVRQRQLAGLPIEQLVEQTK